MTDDLFGQWPPSPADPIMGTKFKIARASDLINPCCEGIAIVGQGRGPHAAGLFCQHCWRWQAWLSKETVSFLTELTRQFGVIDEPILFTDRTPGVGAMRKSDAFLSKFIRATDLIDNKLLVTSSP